MNVLGKPTQRGPKTELLIEKDEDFESVIFLFSKQFNKK